MAADGSRELIRPSESLALAPDRDVRPCGTQDIERKFAQCGEVLSGVVAAVSGAIFVNAHIEHPVHAVLDAPVRPHHGGKALGINWAEDR